MSCGNCTEGKPCCGGKQMAGYNRLGFFPREAVAAAADIMQMKTLEEITKVKFGQPGLDAIRKYSCLTGAKLMGLYYMVEAKPAAQNLLDPRFEIKSQGDDKVVVRGITGCDAVSHEGNIIYEPGDKIAQILPPAIIAASGGSSLPIVIGAIVITLGVGYFIWGRKS